MDIAEVGRQFISGLQQTSFTEFIAVIAGIASVWFSRRENILVYPVGLINTTIYIYLSLKGHLLGEASVNLYYTIVSIYGWILWSKKDQVSHSNVLQISKSSGRQWTGQLAFFAAFYIAIFSALSWLKKDFAPEAIPWADAFASATAYTGMWLMARKKVESWIWWIATNIASIPLYFIKGYVFTSVQFLVLLVLAVAGLIEWNKRAKQHQPVTALRP
ncbi:nicotinamide riboside transporter PnuC [Sediminibacterium ginsengisoli]|uniref:Nicotinamide riboside transporter PnuC n=1 Tax=Sediminibacterium ginsengisoli TaxID=413434 RepID=A0A1T4MAT8_9BACT|nr:nicotinamide riboside transporter PnuC [Sediminibacterium ginsengisoli]SJZ63966.1 nicotinamide mononucleotide transporter [Sediminibacterium ginsengisoli]